MVTASFHYDLSNFGGGAHDGYQQWVYFLDGTLDPTYASNPAQTIDSSTWFQPATWNGSYHEVTNTSDGCGGSYSDVTTATGDNTPAAERVASGWVSVGTAVDPNFYDLNFSVGSSPTSPNGARVVSAACGSPGFTAPVTSVPCAVAPTVPSPNDNSNGVDAASLHGSQQYIDQQAGCRSDFQQTTVTWSLGRGIVDADHDGWDDNTKDNCPPSVLPGTRQIGDPAYTVPASWNPDQSSNPCGYALTVHRSGDGAGTVTGDSIDCGDTCSARYDTGKSVLLKATPAAGSVFDHWEGACSGGGDCTVTMDADKSVTAVFVKRDYTLTVSRGGDGTGTVNGPGIDCGLSCSGQYGAGTTIQLSATANPGSAFDHWGGACSGSGACTVTMSSDQTVTAVFVKTYTLSVSRSGSGSGLVTAQGINCGASCQHSYTEGSVVSLTATADAGSVFQHWEGACSGAGACTVTMSSDQAVIAVFSQAPVNHPPVAQPESWTIAPGQQLSVDAPGVLGNDTDPDGDPVTAKIVQISFASSEWSGLATDGSFTYTAGAGTRMPQVKQITYVAVDSHGAQSAPVTSTIKVNPNQGPVGVPTLSTQKQPRSPEECTVFYSEPTDCIWPLFGWVGSANQISCARPTSAFQAQVSKAAGVSSGTVNYFKISIVVQQRQVSPLTGNYFWKNTASASINSSHWSFPDNTSTPQSFRARFWGNIPVGVARVRVRYEAMNKLRFRSDEAVYYWEGTVCDLPQ